MINAIKAKTQPLFHWYQSLPRLPKALLNLTISQVPIWIGIAWWYGFIPPILPSPLKQISLPNAAQSTSEQLPTGAIALLESSYDGDPLVWRELVFSSDSKQLFSNASDIATLWDVETGEALFSIDNPY